MELKFLLLLIIIIIITFVGLAYLYIESTRFTHKTNNYYYYITKPDIPYDMKNTDYNVDNSEKKLYYFMMKS